MPLPKAQPARLSRPEIDALLEETADALVLSWVSLRRSNEALIQANRENVRLRKLLEEIRLAISFLR